MANRLGLIFLVCVFCAENCLSFEKITTDNGPVPVVIWHGMGILYLILFISGNEAAVEKSQLVLCMDIE